MKKVWNSQQIEYSDLAATWFFRVNTLVTEAGLVIHMLVEKKYPLRKNVLLQMLKLKLESEEDSTMALELIRFVKKQVVRLNLHELDGDDRESLSDSQLTMLHCGRVDNPRSTVLDQTLTITTTNRSHTLLPSQPPTDQTIIMVLMVPYEAFACPCGAGDVVLRESYKPKTHGKLYYACPRSKPLQNTFGCVFLYERRNESVYWLVLLELQRLQFILQDLHRLQFILQDLQHLHAILQELQHLQAILWELQEMQSAQTASTCLIR
ncbi:hypothetical protein Tco_0204254 [Tanacetum coccineum]